MTDPVAGETAAPVPPPTQPYKRSGWASLLRWLKTYGGRHIVGIVFTVISVFPLLYVLSTAFGENRTLSASTVLFQSFSVDNFELLFNDPLRPFERWWINTVMVGTVTAVATVLLCASAAYGFSRFRFRGRRTGLGAMVILQMFPQVLTIVAIFLLLQRFGDAVPILGLGRLPGLIAVYMGGAFGIFSYLMYGYFNTLPRELFDAAQLDGASEIRIFWQIVLPLVRPILVIVGMLVYIAVAGDFAIAAVSLVEPEGQTAAVGLFNMINTLFRNDNWGQFCAGATITAIPAVAMFLYAQRYIVSGLFAGSVK